MSVDEATGRAAIDRVLEGVAATAQTPGGMPAEARDWAAETALQQIKVHEERTARDGIDDLKGLGAEDEPEQTSASRLDRGEIPEDATLIRSSLDQSGTPQAM